MKLKFIILLTFLTISIVFSFPSPAAQESSILFIFDASGSMREKIEGKSKLSIAKETLSALAADLAYEVKSGLMVYGHGREKNRCQDIELIVPLKEENGQAIQARLKPLKAIGKTPIAASLKKAAEAIKKIPGKKRIVLISDGEETCGGDPIKTAQKIKEELGIDVVIDVVGFNVKGKGREQLAAIAQAAGGSYYSADNARQLKDSLSKIKQEVKEQAIKKRKGFKAGGEVFKDDFEGDFISDNWQVVNEDMDNIVLDEGFLTVVNQPGSLGKSAETNKLILKNVLLYKGELPKNYEVVTAFTMEMSDVSDISWRPNQWSGLIFYKNPQNLISLNTLGDNFVYDCFIKAEFMKIQKGKVFPSVMKDINKFNSPDFKIRKAKKNYYFKVKKEKFKYTAYFSKDGQKWVEVGSYTFLGKGLTPGIAAWRSSDSQETVTDFDYFKIRNLE